MTINLTEIYQKVIEDTCTIQQIPAPTFHEQKRAEFLSLKWEETHDLMPETDEAGNVLVFLPGQMDKFQVVISAHMDSVFPLDVPLHIRRDGNRIYGPGIGDNALGCATLLNLPLLIKDIPSPRGNIWLAGTTGEEGLGNLKGMKALLSRFHDTPTIYISLEGMGLGCILHRGLGVNRYRIEVRTPGGHSWTDAGSPSAIHEVVRLSRKLLDLPLPLSPRTTLNIGTIQGGTSINTIASHAAIEVDVRSEMLDTLKRMDELILDTARRFETDSVEISISSIGHRPAGSISEYHPLVNLLERILLHLNISPRREIASTEANLPLSYGIPAVTIGISSGAKAHTLEEYIECQPIEKGLLQLLELIKQIWETSIFSS